MPPPPWLGVFSPFLLLDSGGASDKVHGDCLWIKKIVGGRNNEDRRVFFVSVGVFPRVLSPTLMVPNALELCVDGWQVHEWTCEGGDG